MECLCAIFFPQSLELSASTMLEAMRFAAKAIDTREIRAFGNHSPSSLWTEEKDKQPRGVLGDVLCGDNEVCCPHLGCCDVFNTRELALLHAVSCAKQCRP